ncbi:MAG: outer membrane lipoprotein-sorting protein [Treponema sp.]|jgi:outer membrane lipoprotein-sorting protein|nr:outer membrane lipoprotein-sorting protein [Treponema sp.]
MKKTILLVLCALFAGTVLSAQNAEEIVTASRKRIKADTVSTRARMVITAKDGTTTERIIDQYAKDGPKGNDRTVIVFQRPASVAGTRFLTVENPGAADDRWIFLPNLGKVRRIAASEGAGSFMGTDFSYDDISSATRDAGLDTHKLVREETLNGRNCYVIESVPKNKSYQYVKMVQWIDKENKVTHKMELYNRKNILVKITEMTNLQDVQGRLTPMLIKMTTLTEGTSTALNVDIIKYDDPIPEGVFTTSYLETGRPR